MKLKFMKNIYLKDRINTIYIVSKNYLYKRGEHDMKIDILGYLLTT